MWVRQGRTDAWIAHKLDVSVDELARFKREHDLEGGDEGPRGRPADADVGARRPSRARRTTSTKTTRTRRRRRPTEAPPSASARARSRSRRAGPAAPPRTRLRRATRRGRGRGPEADERRRRPRPDGRETADGDADGAARRRRRGRRGGRRHRTRRKAYEATFDHGGEGYGLWLDPAVTDNPVYSEHWAGHRAVTVTFDAESITIRRADGGPEPESDADSDPTED